MFYKKISINNTEYLIAVNLTGSGAPTELTEGDVGMLYMDTDTGDMYKRTPNGWVNELGDISTALDEIIALQTSYIGGAE